METSTTERRDLEHQIRRTLVPAVVAVLLGRLARVGLEIPADALAGIVEAVIFGIYYVAVSLIERYVPWAGILLGAIGKPTYPDESRMEDRGEHDADF
jgi:hypothetical protein